MIKLTTARLVRNVQKPGQVLTNSLIYTALLTHQIARDLGAGWLVFEKGGAVRSGFDSVALDAEFNDATITHSRDKISTLTLSGVRVSKFTAHRLGDGKKKPKKLMLSFHVEHVGNPFELQEHMIKLGKGDGDLTIDAPEQLELATQPAKEPKEKKHKPPSIRRVKR